MKPSRIHALVLALLLSAGHASAADLPPGWPGAGQLFVGTNYQPFDRSREQIERDIERMKAAGMKVVRFGDLSWDSFEPAEGQFDFRLADWIMDRMQAAGLKVLLDIPGQPAPRWLHHKYPGVDIVNAAGTRLAPAERYMDNTSDPDYRRLLVRLADTLLKRYARHPALFAVGYNNESGNGMLSYSEADRQRFIAWLQKKYGTLDALNKAWATQRWSRRFGQWDEVTLPYQDGPGAYEPNLDLRRFWSQQTIEVLELLDASRRRHAPDKPTISNLWDSAPRKGFDYLSSYRGYASYGAMGFYPGDPLYAAFEATMMRAGMDTPIWFNEFTAGGTGYYGTRGRSRMWAHFGLALGAQAVMPWTWHSHHGGEEQALFGLIDHDDRPSWKLGEFATIAKEFAQLEKLGFPRLQKPQVAIAYAFDNIIATNPPKGISNSVAPYINPGYHKQMLGAYEPLYKDNVDVAVIHIGHEDLSRYKLVIVPGMYLLDRASTDNLRKFVAAGGTALMTAQSAKVNDFNQWHTTPLPGGLTDVFGLRTNEFYNVGDVTVRYADAPDAEFKGKGLAPVEVLEPSTAQALARIVNADGQPPAITVNRFGKGQAIYLATSGQPQLLAPLYRRLYTELGIERGPATPEGVIARTVQGRAYYVNTTGDTKDIAITGTRKGLIGGQTWTGTLKLAPLGAELLDSP
ncbi:beta-galactosidase [Pelomonas sp. P7]|uniref:beta-galactosidase n=1 Tax=Pelomonas caseinilytica TaxID=2906763 RepID=A0ABS8XB68_9BURK|nr:beta-galactosidase [Pelomonas sp. P7]MCE4536933.1 beta-galactosidase [Pelomonas sp. P7]